MTLFTDVFVTESNFLIVTKGKPVIHFTNKRRELEEKDSVYLNIFSK